MTVAAFDAEALHLMRAVQERLQRLTTNRIRLRTRRGRHAHLAVATDSVMARLGAPAD